MSAFNRCFVACLAVLGLVLITGRTAASGTTFPGRNGKIAFSTNHHGTTTGNYEIYTMDPDGTSKRRLTADPAADTNPAWSPDGTELAFNRGIPRPPAGLVDVADIYITGTDGSNAVRVATQVRAEFPVSWAPDGTKIAFSKPLVEGPNNFNEEIFVANTDGTGELRLTNVPNIDWHPVWSPDSQKIAFVSRRASQPGMYVMNADGSNQVFTPITDSFSQPGADELADIVTWAPGPRPVASTRYGIGGGSAPGWDLTWAPDSSKLGFIKGSVFGSSYDYDLATIKPDGTDPQSVTSSPSIFKWELEWAPDSSQFVYERLRNDDNTGGSEIYTINLDGTGNTPLTNSLGINDQDPDWQPIQIGHPRPRSAGLISASLTTAYKPCTSADRMHGPPLAFPSCSNPEMASAFLTLGTPESNGMPDRSVGKMTLRPHVGTPGGNDDADVAISASISDVFNKPGLTDYTGQLRARVELQITDKDSTGVQGAPATVTPVPLEMTASCSATVDPQEGSTCGATTTADALLPGTVKEGKRSVWELGRIAVYDGGPDGDVQTATGDTLFATQGLFVP